MLTSQTCGSAYIMSCDARLSLIAEGIHLIENVLEPFSSATRRRGPVLLLEPSSHDCGHIEKAAENTCTKTALNTPYTSCTGP